MLGDHLAEFLLIERASALMASVRALRKLGMSETEEVRRYGFHYCGVGRPKPLAY